MTTINDLPSDCFQEILAYAGNFYETAGLYPTSGRFCRETILKYKREVIRYGYPVDLPVSPLMKFIKDCCVCEAKDGGIIQDKFYVGAQMKQLDESNNAHKQYKNTLCADFAAQIIDDDTAFKCKHMQDGCINASDVDVVAKKLQEFIENREYQRGYKNYDLSNFINLQKLYINYLQNATIYTTAFKIYLDGLTNVKIIAPKARKIYLCGCVKILIECPKLDKLDITDGECPPVVSARQLYMCTPSMDVNTILSIVNPEVLLCGYFNDKIENPTFKQLIFYSHSMPSEPINVPDHLDLLVFPENPYKKKLCLESFYGKTVSKLIVPNLKLAGQMWQILKRVDKIEICGSEKIVELNKFLDALRK